MEDTGDIESLIITRSITRSSPVYDIP